MRSSRAAASARTRTAALGSAQPSSSGFGSSKPQYGVSAELPALSVCRLEAREELLRKLRQYVDDPALADFTCPICWEPFWQPVRTICGHAFCEGCLLKSVLAQLGQQHPDVSCPLCRHPLHVDDVTADQALLTRIRLVLTDKTREDNCNQKRPVGRVCRGLVRPITPSIAADGQTSEQSTTNTPGLSQGSRPSTSYADAETLRASAMTPLPVCVGRPCTPQIFASSKVEDEFESPIPKFGGWIRVAPSKPSGACGSTQPAVVDRLQHSSSKDSQSANVTCLRDDQLRRPATSNAGITARPLTGSGFKKSSMFSRPSTSSCVPAPNLSMKNVADHFPRQAESASAEKTSGKTHQHRQRCRLVSNSWVSSGANSVCSSFPVTNSRQSCQDALLKPIKDKIAQPSISSDSNITSIQHAPQVRPGARAMTSPSSSRSKGLQSTSLSPNPAAYAADFEFADRYRKLLEDTC